jgi:hypothetical protein
MNILKEGAKGSLSLYDEFSLAMLDYVLVKIDI